MRSTILGSGERAILVGVCGPRGTPEDTEANLAELARLTDTAGGVVVGRYSQVRDRIDPATMVGRGKAAELAQEVDRLRADTVIFDDELGPAQIRNLEEITGAKVIDRSGLILHVFASRARTREAQIQVELAQMEYLLPRLTRRWTHLSRQAGASGSLGLKGVGETQLELDRRQIRRKISRLKRDLSRVEQGRAVRRAGRSGLFTVALVGYTNAGKSTLFNALGGRQVARVEDRLFATLDPTVRRCRTSRGDVYLLIDTVGFLRKLPIDLVASFRSTLEEAGAAHLILHVVDISHPRYEDHMTTTTGVLADLGLLERPTQVVFNKVDLLRARGEEGVEERAAQLHPGAIMASARETEGVPAVREAIGRALGSGLVTIEVAVPVQRVDLVEKIHAAARVLSEAPEGEENRRLRITLQAGREGIVRILAMSGVEEVVA